MGELGEGGQLAIGQGPEEVDQGLVADVVAHGSSLDAGTRRRGRSESQGAPGVRPEHPPLEPCSRQPNTQLVTKRLAVAEYSDGENRAVVAPPRYVQ